MLSGMEKKHMARTVVDPHGHSTFCEEVVEQGYLAKGYTHSQKTKAMCATSERHKMIIGRPQMGRRFSISRKMELDVVNGFLRQHGDLSTGFGVDEDEMGALIGSDEPAMGGAHDVAGAKVRARDAHVVCVGIFCKYEQWSPPGRAVSSSIDVCKITVRKRRQLTGGVNGL